LSGGIKYHHGDLDLKDLTSAVVLILPESIGGCLYLDDLTSAERNELRDKNPQYTIARPSRIYVSK